MTHYAIESSVISAVSHGYPRLKQEGCDEACLISVASLAQLNHPRAVMLAWQSLTNRDISNPNGWLNATVRRELFALRPRS